MNRQIEKIYSKPCRYCSSKEEPIQIFWNESKHYFSLGPNSDSPKHDCHNSSVKHRQLDRDNLVEALKDKRLNEMFADLKSDLGNTLSKIEERFDNLQRAQIHSQSMLTEIRLKINEALTCYGDR
jgi:hypothetical protein